MNIENTIFLMAFSALNILIALFFGFVPDELTYINGTEWIQLKLVTSHFVHHSNQHLWGNLLAFLILLILFNDNLKNYLTGFIICITLTAVFVVYYRIDCFLGSSALLYCIPGCYVMVCLRKQNLLQIIVILMIFLTHIIVISPIKSNYNDQWITLTSAHVIGFISGILGSILINFLNSKTLNRHGSTTI